MMNILARRATPSSSPAIRLQFSRNLSTPITTTAQPKSHQRTIWIALSTTTFISVFYYLYSPYYNTQPPLNPTTFTSWNLQSTEWLSPTSAILNLSHPSAGSPKSRAQWDEIWKAGVWSVQVKQPQLQIQREYTPLPSLPLPSSSTPPTSTTATTSLTLSISPENEPSIRLYVRQVNGGELSSYLLSTKSPLSTIELRGPIHSWPYHSISSRDSSSNNNNNEGHADKIHSILFIAGGTGISPALQVASTLLKQDKTLKMKILWANRKNDEKLPLDVVSWEKEFAGRLAVEQFYDSQNRFIQARDIVKGLKELESLEHMNGRNIVMISGPAGFINIMAGEKVWTDGVETQGPLRGHLATILNKLPADVRKQFEVVKL